MKNHRLNTLAKKLDVDLTQHHRAIYDAEATGYLLLKMLKEAQEKEIQYHDQLNDNMGKGNAYQRARPYHCTLMAQTDIGLKNLFQLVSISQSIIFIEYQGYHVRKFKNTVKGSLLDLPVIKAKFLKE